MTIEKATSTIMCILMNTTQYRINKVIHHTHMTVTTFEVVLYLRLVFFGLSHKGMFSVMLEQKLSEKFWLKKWLRPPISKWAS